MRAKFFFFLFILSHCLCCLEGKFFNPLEDVCWSCIYPIHIAGANVTPGSKDFVKHKNALCHCQTGMVGVPISYWQPTKLIEVTMTPYKLVSLGGMQLSKSEVKKRGTAGTQKGDSVYHVHYYTYPVFDLIGTAADFVCSWDSSFSIGYMSEFDPFWLDDAWNNIIYPEAMLFASPLAVSACIPDCILSTLNKPTNKLFWCAGCQGNLYPLNGFVGEVRGAVQASSLIVHRTLAKMHHWRLAKTFEEGNYCEKTYSNSPRKTAYKIQIAQPIKQTSKKCPVLGAHEFDWGCAKSYPGKGEEFTYVIWERTHCCIDPYKIAKKTATGS